MKQTYIINKNRNNEKGLSLIELLAVIVILGIIVSVAMPSVGNIVNKSRDKAILIEATNVISAAKLANIEGKCVNIGASPTGTGAIECKHTAINLYIDGVDLVVGEKALLESSGWRLFYNKFSEINNNEYKMGISPGIGTPPHATESTLKSLLEK